MKESFKKLISLKLASAFLFLCLNLFIYSQAVANHGPSCHSCGSWGDCFLGNTNLQSAWTDCDVDEDTGRCVVSGTFGSCSNGGQGGPPGQVE